MISAESEIERLEKLVNDLLENNEYLNSEMSDLKNTIQVSPFLFVKVKSK